MVAKFGLDLDQVSNRRGHGTSNLAARRAAKANRRKTIVAQKRRAEAFEGTLAGQVVTAAGCFSARSVLPRCQGRHDPHDGDGTTGLSREAERGDTVGGG